MSTWKRGPGLVGVRWTRLSDGSWWALKRRKMWRVVPEGGWKK